MQRRQLLPLVALTIASLAALAVPTAASASSPSAPGAPGIPSTWTSGNKLGLGTSFADDPSKSKSLVWYTLGAGKMTEVFYPTADSPQVRDLQYIVADGSKYTSVEETDTTQKTVLVDPHALEYEQVDTAKDGAYRITKKYVTDPDRSTVLISTRFEQLSYPSQLHLFVPYNPSLGDADKDTGKSSTGTLVASGSNASTTLKSSVGFTQLTTGYSGTSSDGYRDLTSNHALGSIYDSAPDPGNIVQTAEVPVTHDTSFTLALGFGANAAESSAAASDSLTAGFADRETSYVGGWNSWMTSLRSAPASVSHSAGLLHQYDVALMTLRAHEDKLHPGAFVASLSTPWGQAAGGNAPGYHAIWCRDLYNTATALAAAGDKADAVRALGYILNTQEVLTGSNAGLIPHNTTVTGGSTGLTGIQFDELADPAILADQLGVTDAASWAKIKLSADYLVAHGPATPEERWEEQSGYSPATIAGEIAGLVSAADIATKNGDSASATKYLATADNWQASVEAWTVTHTGPIATPHYERINRDGAPESNETITDSNGSLSDDSRDLVDASFLELVRLGIKPSSDAVITSSRTVADSKLEVTTPTGPLWHRYNGDGYGERPDGSPFGGSGTGKTTGRAWPVLTGERGEYELANGHPDAALADMKEMAATANSAYMIPEQVWDATSIPGFSFGEATDSAAPLAWADAQFVRLAISLSAPKVAGVPANVETPKLVVDRYAGQVTVNLNENASTNWGENVYVTGAGSALGNWDAAKAIPLSSATYPTWAARIGMTAGSTIQYQFIKKAADGSVISKSSVITQTLPASGEVSYSGSF